MFLWHTDVVRQRRTAEHTQVDLPDPVFLRVTMRRTADRPAFRFGGVGHNQMTGRTLRSVPQPRSPESYSNQFRRLREQLRVSSIRAAFL
jgi:hypothetical protein